MPRREDNDQSFTKAPPNPYIKVSQHTKDKLAHMVINENYKVSSAAKILKIHQSTAKMTMRAFKLYSQDKQQQILRSGAIKKKDKIKMEEFEKEKKSGQSQENNKNVSKEIKTIKQNKEREIKVQVNKEITYKQQNQNQITNKQEDIGTFIFVYVPCFYPWQLFGNSGNL